MKPGLLCCAGPPPPHQEQQQQVLLQCMLHALHAHSVRGCCPCCAVLLLQTLRKVKGILNKLTPEKFDRLLGQLIPLINSFEVLQVRFFYSTSYWDSQQGQPCGWRVLFLG